MTLFKGMYRSACSDTVAISSPGISIPAESVIPACCNCPWLGMGGGGLSALVLEPSLSNAATVLTSRNHLTVVTPFISDQDLLVLVTWTDVPSLSTSSPVDPLTGAHREGLALQEHLEECKHCTWSGWVTGSWSYLGWSKLLIFCWVGEWDVWVVRKLPTSKLLGVSCKPQSIGLSGSEGCSCNRVQCLFLLGQKTWSRYRGRYS